MYLIYLLLIMCELTLKYSFSESDFSSSKVTLDYFISVIYEPKFKIEPFVDAQAILEQVINYIQEEYSWRGRIIFRFSTFRDYDHRSDTTAVVSVLSCEDTWTLYRQTDDDGLLFIAATEASCPRLPPSTAITVPLLRLGLELPQFLLDLRTAHVMEWKSVALICDHTMDGELIESLVHAFTTEIEGTKFKSSLVMVYKIAPAQTEWERRKNVVDLLSTVPKLEENSNFLVALNFDLIGVILDVIKQLNLMKPICQWLFVIPHKISHNNLHKFASHLQEGGNVAFVYNSTSHRRCHNGLECHLEGMLQSLVMGLDIGTQAELDKSKKVSEEEWEQIKPTRIERKNSLLQFMLKRSKTEVICDNCTMWRALTAELWGQNFLSASPPGHLLDIGYWNPREGCTLSDQLFPHAKYGFRQMELPVASFHFPPWQIIKYNQSGHAVEFKGVVFEMLNLISKKFNFTYHVINPWNTTSPAVNGFEGNGSATMEKVDAKEDSGSVTAILDVILNLVKQKKANVTSSSPKTSAAMLIIQGNCIIKLLEFHKKCCFKIFLGACALTITENKASFVNFTDPVSIETYVFLVSRPKELSRALLFILPFTSDAWLCIVSSIGLMAPLLHIVHKLSPYYDYFGISKVNGLGRIANCFWYVYGALLQQGGAHLPLADSGRLIIGTWWIVVLVVVTTYCGNLVAFLTFPKMDKLITNVHDLLLRKDFLTWGIPDVSYIKSQLMTAEDPTLQEVYNRAQVHKSMTPEVIEAVRSGRHAYIQSKTRLLYLMKKQFLTTNTCDFSLGNEEFMLEKLGMVMSRDNPYLELFNQEIGKMHRMGLVRKWMMDYLPSRDRCWGNMYASEVNNHTVNLDDMQGSFFLLLLGILLSFLTILLEIFIKKRIQAKEQRIIQPFIQ